MAQNPCEIVCQQVWPYLLTATPKEMSTLDKNPTGRSEASLQRIKSRKSLLKAAISLLVCKNRGRDSLAHGSSGSLVEAMETPSEVVCLQNNSNLHKASLLQIQTKVTQVFQRPENHMKPRRSLVKSEFGLSSPHDGFSDSKMPLA